MHDFDRAVQRKTESVLKVALEATQRGSPAKATSSRPLA